MTQSSLNDLAERAAAARDRVSPSLYFVTEDGFAYQPAADPSGGEPARPLGRIERLLGAHTVAARQRLGEQIRDASRDERRGLTLLRDGAGTGQLVTVRPGHAPGHATVLVEALETVTTRLDSALLVELFGLAPAEAEIALGLTNDQSIFEIAAVRRVQPETVRGQVKSLLRKMCLSSQKQLVRMLTRLDMALEH
jgi:DNA-binding CsgD family transcriptional regulator